VEDDATRTGEPEVGAAGELTGRADQGPVVRVCEPDQARALYDEICRPERQLPIVALTCRPGRRDPELPADKVRERIWPNVPIYVIEPRESRTLNDMLEQGLGTKDLGVWGGAGRVWWPGVDRDAHPPWHPLIYEPSKEYGEAALARIGSEFTTVPESLQELSPREKTAAQLRAVPRPSEAPRAEAGAKVVPLATRKDLRRLTTDLRADRDYPIVVLTIARDSDGPAFDPADLRARLATRVTIYVLGSPDLCRRLAHVVGGKLAVADGDARVYWSGAADDGADPPDHPLVSVTSGDLGKPTERLIAAIERSRPGVREDLAAFREQLQDASARASNAVRQLREARGETNALTERVETAEREREVADGKLAALVDAGVDPAEIELIAALDLEGRLHRLIGREWLRANATTEERARHPLRYVFDSGFVQSVESLTGTSLQRVAWVAAMIACGRAKSIPGIEPHQLRETSAGSSNQVVRCEDGAKAWRCKLAGEGFSRLHYWQRTDGIRELASVGVHDARGALS